jgi:hypothetical protein
MITGKIVHSLEYGRTRDKFMFVSGESNSVIIRHQLKPVIRKKKKAVDFLSSSLCLQHNDAWPRTACHPVKYPGLNPEVLPQPPNLLALAPCDFHFFGPPKRHSTWTSLQVIWRRKGGGACLAGTANTSLLHPRNLCLSGTLEEMRRKS